MGWQKIYKFLHLNPTLVFKLIKTFFSKGISIIGGFLLSILLVRLLGTEGVGAYYLIFNLMMIIAMFTSFGFHITLVRFIAPLWEKKELNKIRGIYAFSISFLAGFSLIIAIIFIYSNQVLANRVFHNALLAELIIIAAITILPFSLIRLHSGVLKGLHMPAVATFLETGSNTLLASIFLFFLSVYYQNISPSLAFWVYLLAVIIGMLWSMSLIAYKLSHTKIEIYQPKKIIQVSHYIMWITSLNYFILWSASLFIGAYLEEDQVGFYNIAFRIALLLSSIKVVFNAIFLPKFATLYEEGKFQDLEKMVQKVTWQMTMFALPLLLIIFIYPYTILNLFGEKFYPAADILRILILGQFFSIAGGSVALLLMVTGHEKVMLKITIILVLFSITLNMILIPLIGTIGAAWATTILMLSQIVVFTWLVKIKLNIFPATFLKKLIYKA